MKVLIQRNNRQKLASKIAAASFIKQGIPSNDILFLEFENNILLKSKVGKKYLRKGKIKIFKDDLQSFTLLRFLGPEFIKYKEKILIIDPDRVFSFDISIFVLLLTVLGGVGNVWGPLIGTIILIPITEYSRIWFGGTGGAIDLMIYGVILMLICVFRPEGLISMFPSKFLEREKQR